MTDSFHSALSGKRLLVTGANGFIGRRLLHLGQRLGLDMQGMGRQSADLRDPASVSAFIEKTAPDAILHLAAAGVGYGTGTLPELMAVNAAGFSNLLEAATKLPSPPVIVAAGSGFEYTPQDRPLREDDPTDPQNNYGISKVAATQVAATFADRLPITMLRLFSVYGLGEPAARLAPYVVHRIRSGQPVDLTPCEQIRDYTYADDLAEAFLRAAANPPRDGKLRTLNTATGRACTLRQFVELLADALHRAEGVKADFRFGAQPYRPDEIKYYAPDVSRLRAILGWTPPTTLEDGVRLFIGKNA